MKYEYLKKENGEEMNRFEKQWFDRENGMVKCDEFCQAKENPETLEECKETLEHYKQHSLLSGCSHGC